MDKTPDINPALEARILARIAEDHTEGSVKSHEEYRVLFPGHEATVKRILGELSTPVTVSDEVTDCRVDVPLDRIGPFELVRELGRGGQGVVYLALDSRLENRRVALKVLATQLQDTVALRHRFEREARLTARLNHPGIAPIYEVGEDDGIHYIAMGYIEGEPLSQRIHETQTSQVLSESEFISFEDNDEPRTNTGKSSDTTKTLNMERATEMTRIVLGVSEILHVAHSAGLIHRDIKPSNIMVTPSGQPVLLDFGLARDEESDEALTVSGAAMGTPAYMSPEQIGGHRARIDHRTDIYSLGVTLYEAVAMARPYRASTRQGLYRAILQGTVPDIRRKNPKVSRDLRVVIETMLDVNPDRRYQTAQLMSNDLRAVLDWRSISARPAGWFTKVRRWARRNPLVAVSSTAALVILVVSLIIISNTLGDYRELADLQLVEQMEVEAVELLPAVGFNVDGMENWVERAVVLTESLPRHRKKLAAIRAQSLPYTNDDRLEDLETHKDVPALRNLERRISMLDQQLDLLQSQGQQLHKQDEQRLDDALDEMERDSAAILKRIETRRTYRFKNHEVKWQHDAIASLVHGLNHLAETTLPDMRQRLIQAREIQRESHITHKALWEEAIASIANREQCPLYKGLQIPIQEGLVPINRSDESGLWTFRHIASEDQGSETPDSRSHIFVLLPGGAFQLGASRDENTGPHLDRFARKDERPVKELVLDPFFMSAHEVTQRDWQRLMGSNPSYHPAGSLMGRVVTWQSPVESVTHGEAMEYCRRMDLSLPTEAQWEYAARAGSTTIWPTGDERDSLAGTLNIADGSALIAGANWEAAADWSDLEDGHVTHAPVGSYLCNKFGLFDMQGNVWEWCRDGYGKYTSATETGTGLRTETRDKVFVYRGGSFRNTADRARSASRQSAGATVRSGSVGLRPMRSVRR